MAWLLMAQIPQVFVLLVLQASSYLVEEHDFQHLLIHVREHYEVGGEPKIPWKLAQNHVKAENLHDHHVFLSLSEVVLTTWP